MNIGIIIYSQTGNTYSLAQKLKDKFSNAGHSVNMERIIPIGNVHPGVKNLQLKTRPKTDSYDLLVFGSPVMAFSLSPAMKIYLAQLSSLRNKKVICFVTKKLPFNWTGGSQAISWMKKICESKGASVCGTGILVWSRLSQRIIEFVDRLVNLL